MGAYLDAINHFQYTLLPFPSELLYLGLGYEEGRELPHQSAKCAPINEGELLYFNKSGIFTTYANHVVINTISATGTTSTTATVTQLLTLENKTTNFKQFYSNITSSLS